MYRPRIPCALSFFVCAVFSFLFWFRSIFVALCIYGEPFVIITLFVCVLFLFFHAMCSNERLCLIHFTRNLSPIYTFSMLYILRFASNAVTVILMLFCVPFESRVWDIAIFATRDTCGESEPFKKERQRDHLEFLVQVYLFLLFAKYKHTHTQCDQKCRDRKWETVNAL